MSNVYCSTKCRTQCSTTTSLTFVTQIPEEAPAVSETYLVQLNVDDRNAKKKKLNHRVHWSKDTKDNEFLNRKKSKICCVYRKPRSFQESSSYEDTSDSDTLLKSFKKKSGKASLCTGCSPPRLPEEEFPL